MSAMPKHTTETGLPIVRTHRDITGNFSFDPVELEIVGKNDEGAFFGPALAIHYEMISGESRRPLIISPQMVLPMITQLAHWAAQVSGDGVMPVPEPVAEQVEAAVDPMKRREGESRDEWETRVRDIMKGDDNADDHQ